jgi:nucleotide-binding universal stress UspA family protein
MGRVLCCVDDSDHARAVARYAAELAGALGHQLVLVHVAVSTHAPGVSAAPAGRRRLHEAELRDATELVDRVVAESELPSDLERRAEIGDPADRILALCEEADAELVVLGSRGRGSLKSALLGSVSTKVAASAPCPCVIVSGHAAERLATT